MRFGFIVTTVEPRPLNTSLLRILKVEWTLGEPKSLGLNWNNRCDSYIRNGMHCNYTGSRCSYICKVKTFETYFVARYVNYNKKKTICQFEGMKLDHRNYLDLNESQTVRMCRLVCAFNVCMQLRQVFSQHGP